MFNYCFLKSYHGFRKSAVGCVGSMGSNGRLLLSLLYYYTYVVPVQAVPGILARDSFTINLVSKLLLDECYIAKFDPNVLPIPWNELVCRT